MVRILVASDIHVHNWMNYATLDSRGVPDRLIAYQKLAHDLAELAKREKVGVVVIPGDLLHGAVSEPMVLSVARGFLETLAKTGLPIIVTHGQHDHASKSHSTSAIHSVITGIAPDRDGLNIIYVPEPMVVEEAGLSFYVHPWVENVEEIKYEKADIFVGHGIVDQARNCEGYSFVGGFKPEKLSKLYNLSIIGDIHKGQVFEAKNGSITLIPGAPIQNSWRDDPNPGVWIVDYGKRTKMKFFSIYSLRDDGTYHRFLKIKESEYKDEMAKPSVHYKIVYGEEDEIKEAEEVSSQSVDSMSLVEVAMEEVHKHKPERPDLFKEILNEAMKILPGKELKAPARVRTWSVEATNFLSIKHFFFNVSELGEILVSGKNGSGKTSLMEAFYYGWTGETTKPIAVGDVSNWNIDGDMEVVIDFSIIKKKVERFWRIRRGRTADGSSYLTLYKVNGDKQQAFRKGSMKDTQQHIYNMIGLDKDDILLMCYYSTRKLKTFSNIGDTSKNSVTGRLINFDQIYNLRDAVNSLLIEYTSEADITLGKIQELEGLANSKQNKLEEIESEEEMESEKAKIEPDLTQVYDTVPFVKEGMSVKGLRKFLKKLEAKYRKLADSAPEPPDEEDPLKIKLKKLESRIKETVMDIDLLRSSISEFRAKVENSKDTNSCYACGQELTSDEVIEDLEKKIKAYKKTEVEKQRVARKMNNRYLRVKDSLSEKKFAEEKDFRKYKKVRNKLNQIRDALDLLSEVAQPVKKRDFTEAKKILNEDLDKAKENARLYKKKLVRIGHRKEAAGLLKTKILSATGPVVRRYNELICSMIGKEINRMIIDPAQVRARAVVGKSIDVEMKFRKGKWTPFASMSGGEERIANILVMLSMNNLFSRKYRLKRGVLGIAIFDEVFSFLDPEFTDVAFAALQNCIADARIVITHDTRLQSYFDRSILVRKVKGGSKYKLLQ